MFTDTINYFVWLYAIGIVVFLFPRFHLEVDKKHNVERYAVAILSARTGIKVKLSLV